jgi:hypothetical protein
MPYLNHNLAQCVDQIMGDVKISDQKMARFISKELSTYRANATQVLEKYRENRRGYRFLGVRKLFNRVDEEDKLFSKSESDQFSKKQYQLALSVVQGITDLTSLRLGIIRLEVISKYAEYTRNLRFAEYFKHKLGTQKEYEKHEVDPKKSETLSWRINVSISILRGFNEKLKSDQSNDRGKREDALYSFINKKLEDKYEEYLSLHPKVKASLRYLELQDEKKECARAIQEIKHRFSDWDREDIRRINDLAKKIAARKNWYSHGETKYSARDCMKKAREEFENSMNELREELDTEQNRQLEIQNELDRLAGNITDGDLRFAVGLRALQIDLQLMQLEPEKTDKFISDLCDELRRKYGLSSDAGSDAKLSNRVGELRAPDARLALISSSSSSVVNNDAKLPENRGLDGSEHRPQPPGGPPLF